jgi:hypothetical protein
VADLPLLQSADNEPYQVASWGAGGTSTRSRLYVQVVLTASPIEALALRLRDTLSAHLAIYGRSVFP